MCHNMYKKEDETKRDGSTASTYIVERKSDEPHKHDELGW